MIGEKRDFFPFIVSVISPLQSIHAPVSTTFLKNKAKQRNDGHIYWASIVHYRKCAFSRCACECELTVSLPLFPLSLCSEEDRGERRRSPGRLREWERQNYRACLSFSLGIDLKYQVQEWKRRAKVECQTLLLVLLYSPFAYTLSQRWTIRKALS